MNDYADYKETDPAPATNSVAVVAGLVADYRATEALIESLEAQLQEAKNRLRQLSEGDIPKLMDEMQTQSFTLANGTTVEVDEKIRANIKKENQEPAHEWLNDHDQSGLIKRQFVIQFNRDQEAWANKFQRDLAQRKKPLNVQRKESVHPQTLNAFVKEQLENGVELPLDLFGVHRQRFTKIKG